MSGTEKKPTPDLPGLDVDNGMAAQVKGGAEPVSRPKPLDPVNGVKKI
mgnify:CR=1 FL=1